MKRLALVLSIVALASCRDNRASIVIQDICFPSDDCSFTGKCDTSLNGTPIVDVSLVHQLELFLQLENQLANNANLGAGKTNTNDAHVNEVVVSYEGVALPRDVFNVGNHLVPTNGTTVLGVEVIRYSTTNVAMLNAAAPAGLVAKIRLRGYFDDGSTFETGDFTTAVTLCVGCLSATPCAAGKAACPFAGMDPIGCGST
ncbi:MAG TPA: hypothetical protein VF875_17655 [Anaeromyxobacter sp.]